MINRVIVLCLALVLGSASGSVFRTLYANHQNSNQRHQRDFTLDELKNAHYFTKHLEASGPEAARRHGLVNMESDEVLGVKAAGDFTSYAGYFTVNKACNSNLYTWFFQNKVRHLSLTNGQLLDSTSFSIAYEFLFIGNHFSVHFGYQRIEKLISFCFASRTHLHRCCCGYKVFTDLDSFII